MPEILNADPDELLPFDMIDEGRRIHTIHRDIETGKVTIDVGLIEIEHRLLMMGDGTVRCFRQPVWGHMETITVNYPMRIVRGVDPHGPPCDHDLCTV